MFALLGSVWVPQIILNIVNNTRNSPDLKYAFWQSVHILYIPMYLKGIQSNCLFTLAEPAFVIIMSLWLLLQLFCLRRQQDRPRFLLPKRLSIYLFSNGDFHRYERHFLSEIDKNSTGLLRPEDLNSNGGPAAESDKPPRGINRKSKIEGILRDRDCGICSW